MEMAKISDAALLAALAQLDLPLPYSSKASIICFLLPAAFMA